MSKCEECIFSDRCDKYHIATDEGKYAYQNIDLSTRDDVEEICDDFKGKSLFVELPCATGIPLFFIYNRPYADKPDLTPQIYETNEWYFEVDEKEIAICPRMIHGLNGNYYYHLGKTVFLDREEAKKKLKEMGGKK